MTSLRWLTWGTIAGSVASALLLAAGDSAPTGHHRAAPVGRLGLSREEPRLLLPAVPLRVGEAAPASGASH